MVMIVWKSLFLSTGAVLLALSWMAPTVVLAACPVEPEVVTIPGGDFMMGSPPGEQGRAEDETLYRARSTWSEA